MSHLYVALNDEGQYLVVSSRTTHVGTHTDYSWVSDLNQASTLTAPERNRVKKEVPQIVAVLQAMETRKVRLAA
ncbi:hypothetical protein [Kiloniella sp.]|uniref:hypothetical protein n=1 Tax=Kiloniella sp. TaxID=1938587 RepID=UPI003B0247F6